MSDAPGPDFPGAVLAAVGGASNVDELTHCMVRLRFTLLDDGRADDAALQALPEVLLVVRQGGQLQLALTVPVPAAYQVVRAALDAAR